MEYLALLIPIVAGLILHYMFKKHVLWWEALLPALPVLILIPLVKFSAETYETTDYERHGGWCVEAVYVEDWDEWISRTCSSTDKDGKVTTYDCSYRLYHPPEWYLIDSNDYRVTIAKNDYEYLAAKFNSRVFKDMHRWYYTDDGDEYHSLWPRSEGTFQPITTEHRYENRVQATHGVLDFVDVDKATVTKLFSYPKCDTLNDQCILGTCDNLQEAQKRLQRFNAKFGKEKEVHVWLLIFKDQPLSIGLDQESYWKGGNKNEVVVTISLDSNNKAQWCRTFCWSPDGYSGNDTLRVEIRDYVMGQKTFDAFEAVEYIEKEIVAQYRRKEFKEFSYLTVDTPGWAVVIIWLLTVITTIGVSIFIVVNETTEDNPTGTIDNIVKTVEAIAESIGNS